MSNVQPVPEGFNTVSPYLVVPNAAEALQFYQQAFGAEPGLRLAGPAGEHSTMHAEMRIGNSMILLTDENPQWGSKSPRTLGGTAVSLHLYVEDAEALFERAVAAGCAVQSPLQEMFWGDQFGKLNDPFGHVWSIATRKKNLTSDEIARNARKWIDKTSAGSSCSDQA